MQTLFQFSCSLRLEHANPVSVQLFIKIIKLTIVGFFGIVMMFLFASEGDFQHRTVGPVWGGVDIAISQEIRGFETWDCVWLEKYREINAGKRAKPLFYSVLEHQRLIFHTLLLGPVSYTHLTLPTKA